jgi:flagellar hook-associated protein 2
MSDTLRMTGLYSGMDTESIIEALVSAKSEKVTTLQNEQKKLEWTQNVWQDLNSQIYSLYSKTLSNMRLSSSYAKKTTKISDSTKATIVASSTAVNGTQTLQINKTAKAGYLTGASLATKVETETASFTEGSKLSDIDSSLVGKTIKMSVQVQDSNDSSKINTNTVEFEIGADTKISDVVSALSNDTGVTASYDTNSNSFVFTTDDSSTKIMFEEGENSSRALSSLGLSSYTSYQSGKTTGATPSQYTFSGSTMGKKVTTKIRVSQQAACLQISTQRLVARG